MDSATSQRLVPQALAWHVPTTTYVDSYSGTNRICPISAAPADTLDVSSVASDVQTDVIGDSDGLEDDHGEGASTATIVDNDVTLPSSWSPPADLVSTFDSLVGINAGAKPSVSDLLQCP